MYLSESVQGEPITVTGLVAVPEAPAPAGGRPVVSVGSGTAGIADTCAPSRFTPQLDEAARRLGLGEDRGDCLGDFADAGYVVAQTDYEGLGTPGVHPYLVGVSEGRGFPDAAQPPGSCRTRTPATGSPCGATPRAGTRCSGPTSSLTSGPRTCTWLAPWRVHPSASSSRPSPELGVVTEYNFMLLVAGFAAAYPDADPALVLTDAGMAVLEDVRSTGRRDTAAALTLATAGAEPANLVRLQLGDVSAAGHRMVVQRHRKIFHRMFHLRVTPRPRWPP